MFGDIEKQQLWYEYVQAKVMNLLDPLRVSIATLQHQIEDRMGKSDQLKFFDYIYPSISQRLCKLENEISELKEIIMPLVKGKKASSKKGFSENVKREMHEGKPQKQAVAIAYSEARRGKKKKGKK